MLWKQKILQVDRNINVPKFSLILEVRNLLWLTGELNGKW